MKKKNLTILVATAFFAMSLFAGCAKNDTTLPTPSPKITQTSTPVPDKVTETVPPTIPLTEITPTEQEIVLPDTPAPTETLAPIELTPTILPVPTEAPVTQPPVTPELSTIPTETPTPEPTATPEPTPIVWDDNHMILMFQAGDDVWYKYYDDGTLRVTGTGSTWDDDDEWIEGVGWKGKFDLLREAAGDAKIIVPHNGKNYECYKIADFVTKIIVEEGITHIGTYALAMYQDVTSVTLPSSLKSIGEYGFKSTGDGWLNDDIETVEWIGLDFSNIIAEPNSFSEVKGIENYKDAIQYAVTPTPCPTATPIPPYSSPTPTPIPDPDNPRLCYTYQMGASGSNVTYEFWDNGYLYIKGKGKILDRGELFNWDSYTDDYDTGFLNMREQAAGMDKSTAFFQYPEVWEQIRSSNSKIGKEVDAFLDSIKYVVVEDGITYLASGALIVKEMWLPKSVTDVAYHTNFRTEVLHCYQGDTAVTLTARVLVNPNTGERYQYHEYIDILFKALTDPEIAERYEVTITKE